MTEEYATKTSLPLVGLIINFILWSMLGICFGFVFLASKPPTGINSSDSLIPEANEEVPVLFRMNKEVRYYKNQSIRHRVEAFAKKLFSSTSNQIEVTSADLNSWADAQFTNQNGYEKSKNENPSISFKPEQPSFQIASKQLHINYPVSVEAFGQKTDMLILCSGDFTAGEASPKWKLSNLSINSAPVPFKNLVYNLVKPRILDAIADNEEMEKVLSAWNIIQKIEIQNSTMIIHRK